ncbi:MAG: hypothetical protein DWP97_05255 [Calditrichaeota bacterium]|nr:MAG: hypothetical protein DWP97_05255 [Calditrichota bacterium]
MGWVSVQFMLRGLQLHKQKHFENTGTVRFVTFSCYHNYNLFKTDKVKQIFIKHLKRVREKYKFKLYGFVIMPNHVHIVLLPINNVRLSQIIGELKSLSAREIIEYWTLLDLNIFEKLKVNRSGKQKFAFWQRKYYDYNCRTKEITLNKIMYCHNNPVVKGLVENLEDWEWSSYRWYYGLESVLEMD